MKGIILTFIYSLFLTLVLELAIGLLFRLKRKDILLLLLINILTNPAAVYLNILCQSFLNINMYLWQLPIEISVVIIEWHCYRRFASALRRPFLLALLANTFSYSCGILINTFI